MNGQVPPTLVVIIVLVIVIGISPLVLAMIGVLACPELACGEQRRTRRRVIVLVVVILLVLGQSRQECRSYVAREVSYRSSNVLQERSAGGDDRHIQLVVQVPAAQHGRGAQYAGRGQRRRLGELPSIHGKRAAES